MQDKSNFPDITEKGVYCLIFKNKDSSLDTGRFQGVVFSSGYHVYVGSALGSGGLKRLKRHVLFSLMKDKKPRWHVDHLSVSSKFDLVCVVYALVDEAVECQLAGKLNEALDGDIIRGFGSSDCNCPSHLFHNDTCPRNIIGNVFNDMGLEPNAICFK
ncbi:GIY-YIG nuclease family protein [Methanolobus profundi]|uniref:Uri superfamily endonuclease n=1 Tax=Methanolobus profundi TaxID=487685 RepID=A0A1I4SVB0_9EURY|nr:DUF123 domain-containing protein [Methanolobus profundi]SFM68371.1 Uri superfamily endonuclease [Methanolobus profundi]